jgi:ferritin
MLISDKLNQAMNAQVGSELGASHQYLQIAAYFEREFLPELADFFYRQSDEERLHALKFVHYIVEAGGSLAIPEVPAPAFKLDSAEAAAKLALEWELEVTNQINQLIDMAIKENDHIAQQFLRWFATEQLEEVATMDELLGVIRRAGAQLLFVEQYIARRGDPHAGEAEQ